MKLYVAPVIIILMAAAAAGVIGWNIWWFNQ
jgi:hypothetical protein